MRRGEHVRRFHHREVESMHSHDPNTRVFVFWCFHNNLHQVLRLKTIEICSFGVGGWKSKIKLLSGLHSLQRLSGRICCFSSLWWLPPFLDRAVSHQSLPPPSLHVCVLSVVLEGYLSMALGPTQIIQNQLNPNLIILANPFPQTR